MTHKWQRKLKLWQKILVLIHLFIILTPEVHLYCFFSLNLAKTLQFIMTIFVKYQAFDLNRPFCCSNFLIIMGSVQVFYVFNP